MSGREILTKGNNHVYIEYDDSKFDIEYHGPSDNFVISYADKWLLAVIPAKEVGFIIQSNVKMPNYKDLQARFIMSRYDKQYNEWCLEVCHPNGHGLYDRVKKPIQYPGLNYVRISGNTFEIYDDGDYRLYNVDTDKESESFKSIDKCTGASPLKGKILVSQERVVKHPSTDIGFFRDYIFYGIDPVTFEATTPIWSQLQDKTFPISSEFEYEDHKVGDETITEYTIRTRIDNHIQKMVDKIPVRNYDLIDRELAGIHLGFKPSKKKKNEEENK